jgi:signal transduction histidine kinase
VDRNVDAGIKRRLLICILLLCCAAVISAAGTREAGQTVFSLDGLWQYALQSDDSQLTPPAPAGYQPIELPLPRFEFPPGDTDVLWLRKEIPAGAAGSFDEPGLYLGKLPDYSRVYINGRLSLISGSGPPGKYYGNPFFSHALVLPAELFDSGDPIRIDIRIYSRKETATLGSMAIGEWRYVAPKARLESLINRGQGIAVSVIGFLTFLYFIVIFSMEPDRSGRAYLAFASLGFAVNATILFVLRSPFSYLTMFKIQTIGLHIGVLGMVMFVQEFVEIHQKSWVRYLFVSATAAALLLIASSTDISQAMFRNDALIYLGLTAPLLIYCIAMGVVGIVKKLDAGWALMIGILIIVITAGRDVIIASMGITPVVYLNLLGLTVFIVIIFLAYAANFVHARRIITAQAAELEQNVKTLELSEKQLLANERLALIGSLVAGVHHEVRTPMGNALLVSTFLKDEAERIRGELEKNQLTLSSMRDFLDKSESGLSQMTESLSMADQLLDNFRNSARDQVIEEKRCIDIEDYIPKVVESLRPRFKRTAIAIHLDLTSVPPSLLYPGTLWQIISNLLLNAVTHAFPEKKEGNIHIRSGLDNGSISLTIQDDGVGMSDEVRERAFETFFTTRPGEGGTGLGLSIVKNLVEESLGGEIGLTSAPGEGSSFLIRWPLEPCRG